MRIPSSTRRRNESACLVAVRRHGFRRLRDSRSQHAARDDARRASRPEALESATMAGCLTALVIMLSVSAAGLGVFLEAWPRLFDTLRFIGAAYLVWLGLKNWRAKAIAIDIRDESGAKRSTGRFRLYRNGFLVGASIRRRFFSRRRSCRSSSTRAARCSRSLRCSFRLSPSSR